VPEGPNITETSPGGSVKETSFQMAWLPKDFVRSSMTTSAPIAPPGACSWTSVPRLAGSRQHPWRQLPLHSGQRARWDQVTHQFANWEDAVHISIWDTTQEATLTNSSGRLTTLVVSRPERTSA